MADHRQSESATAQKVGPRPVEPAACNGGTKLSRTFRTAPETGGRQNGTVPNAQHQGIPTVSKGKTIRRSRRLNRRALIILVGLLVLISAALAGIKVYRDSSGARTYFVEARKLIEQKKTNLAIGYLNKYLELRPNDPEALTLKAELFADSATTLSEVNDAAKLLSQAIEGAADGSERRALRKRLIKLLVRVGAPNWQPSAEAHAALLISKDGANDAEAYRLYGQTLEYGGYLQKNDKVQYEKASAAYAKALKKDPTDILAVEQFGYLRRERMEDRKGAQDALDRVVELTAKDPEKHSRALLARFRHHYAVFLNTKTSADERQQASTAAEADVVAAVKADSTDLEARLAAATFALTARGDTADARLHLENIPAEKRQTLRVKYLEGMIGLNDRDPDEAIQAWRAGLVMTGGTDEKLTSGLAEVLIESGRLAEARPLIEQFRRLTGGEISNPRNRESHEANDAKYHYLKGLALLKDNHPQEAITELELVRFKNLTDETTHKNMEGYLYLTLGQAYEAVREPEKALDAYRRSAEITADSPNAWVALARLQATSQTDQAETTLRRGLALMPNNSKLVTTLAEVLWRRQMSKAPAQRSWKEVEQLMESARQEAPGSVELALLKADYYAARGQSDDAVELLKGATEKTPKSPELWLALANALSRRGNYGQALDTLDRAEAPGAAGPHAVLAITRATVLGIKGQVADARKALIDAIDKVPATERPALFKTLGDYYANQKDVTSARAQYEQWARLAPQNTEPRVSIFLLVLSSNDDAAISRAVDDLKRVSPDTYHWRWARVEELLRTRLKETADAGRDQKRRDEAKELIAEIQKIAPQIPLGYLLEARLAEVNKDVDAAVIAYKKALERRAGPAALNPLVALLIRENREQDLDAIRKELALDPNELDRLAAAQAMKAGNKGRAEELAELAVKGDPKGIDVRIWQADVLKALGKPDAAETALRVAIGQKPADPSPWLSLLMLQINQHKTAEAAATVEQIRDKVETPNKDLMLAQCYRAIGNLRRADDSFREALRKSPNEPTVQAAAIIFYEQIGRVDDAESSLRAMIRRDKDNSWATRKLALLLANRSSNRPAWEEALALVKPEPQPDDVPDNLIIRATIYSQGPEPAHRAKALAILEKLLADMPSLTKVHEQVARIAYVTGDLPKARSHAATAAAGDGASAEAIMFHAAMLLASKDNKGAEVELERLSKLDPDSLPVAELKARLLAARGKAGEGVVVLEKAFADRAASLEGIAVGRLMLSLLTTPPLKDFDAAERVGRKLAANSARGRCMLAEILASRDKIDEAVAEIAAADKAGDTVAAANVVINLAAKPNADKRWLGLAEKMLTTGRDSASTNSDLLMEVAMVQHMKADFASEIASYQRILNSKPTNYLFLNNMAWTLSEDLHQPKEALKQIDEAIKKIGPLPQLLDTRGVILTRLGRFDDAVKDLETAVKAMKDPTAEFHLARVYLKLGDTAAAQTHRDRAREGGLTREQLQACDRADWDTVMK